MAHAIIVGAGVGGLAASLCLADAGWQVTVAERADAIQGVGAGLQISPNAARVLEHLGLGSALQSRAFAPKAIEMRDGLSARLLARTPIDGRWGAPYWHLHRGDLIDVLVHAVQEHDKVELDAGVEVTGVVKHDDHVELTTGAGSLKGDVVVGADGIHSNVRRSLFGDESPRFTGNVAYRGLVGAEHLGPELIAPVATARLGPGAHFVHYYVRGGNLVNCVAVVEEDDWRGESWVEPASIDSLRAAFDGWADPVASLIDAMVPSSVFRWALFDREPMSRWSRGRATLLGDACHATLPFMAQGAAMAIEDAAVLAQELDVDDIEASLVRYEARRIGRTSFVQRASRRNATVYHLSGLAARARNLVLPFAGRQTMDKLYGFDVYAGVDAGRVTR